MAEASIKGSAFVGVVEDLNELLAGGAVPRAALEERLEPVDVAFLDDEISPGFWYPMSSYDRMLSALVHYESEGDPRAYLRARGERAMKRLMAMGLYAQFASLEKGWTRLAGRVMMTMGSAVYNFLSFELQPGEIAADASPMAAASRFTLLVRDGGRLSNHACTTIEGAVAALATRAANGAVKVWSRRVGPEEVEIYAERLAE